jgi:hypothetical protein
MAGPATVVVAGLATAWIAFHGADGLVVDDYYKQGLAINQTLGRTDAAERLGVQAELRFADGRVRVILGNSAVRGALTLRLVHPTRAGMDQNVNLAAVEPGIYEPNMHAPQRGRWHVVLEERDWRLAGDWTFPAAAKLTLGNHFPAPAEARTQSEGNR